MTCLFFLGFSLLVNRYDPSDSIPAVADLEKAVLDQRRQIHRGEVELDSLLWQHINGVRSLQSHRVTTIWFDGDNIRGDTRLAGQAQSERAGSAPRMLTCYFNKSFIYWDEGKTVVSIDTAKKLPDRKLYAPPNPRLIGMAPMDSANLGHFSLESFLNRPDRSAPTVIRAKLNQRDCWQIESRRNDGLTFRAWLDPACGLAIVRMETEGTDGTSTYLDSIAADYQKAPVDEIWFPTKVHYERKTNNKISREEDLVIKLISLNKALDANVFKLAGMNIAPGTVIQRTPGDANGSNLWDGNKEIPRPPMEPASIKRPLTFGRRLSELGRLALPWLGAFHGSWHVPKKGLVTSLVGLLEDRRLKVARNLVEARTLVDELLNFKMAITDSANVTYGAWRSGQHDGLVLAVALAWWWAEGSRAVRSQAGVAE